MIDLHNHILPGLDDGAVDWEESIAMAEAARDDGIKGIVCTPHWVIGQYQNDAATVRAKVEQLRNRLRKSRVDIAIYPGTELRLDPSMQSQIEAGTLLTLNDTGRYALIELPMYLPPSGVEPFVRKIQQNGIVPIIAHPERYLWASDQPQRLHFWAATGCLIQLTAASLLGHFGRKIEALSILLLEHGLVHVIATDTHGLLLRSPKLSEARRKAADILGEIPGSRLVGDNPRRIVQGRTLEPPEPTPIEPRKSWYDFSALRSSADSFLKRMKGRNS